MSEVLTTVRKREMVRRKTKRGQAMPTMIKLSLTTPITTRRRQCRIGTYPPLTPISELWLSLTWRAIML